MPPVVSTFTASVKVTVTGITAPALYAPLGAVEDTFSTTGSVAMTIALL